MSYESALYAITTFLHDQAFFDLTPFGLDGESVEQADGAGYMRVIHGTGEQQSIGSPGSNLHKYAGVLAVNFWNRSGADSRDRSIVADKIVDALTGAKIDETGSLVSSGASIVVDFASAGVPTIAATLDEGHLVRTVVNAPFTRTERK